MLMCDSINTDMVSTAVNILKSIGCKEIVGMMVQIISEKFCRDLFYNVKSCKITGV